MRCVKYSERPGQPALCTNQLVGTVTRAFDQPRTHALPLQILCHLLTLGSGNQLHPTGLHQPALTLSHRTPTNNQLARQLHAFSHRVPFDGPLSNLATAAKAVGILRHRECPRPHGVMGGRWRGGPCTQAPVCESLRLMAASRAAAAAGGTSSAPSPAPPPPQRCGCPRAAAARCGAGGRRWRRPAAAAVHRPAACRAAAGRPARGGGGEERGQGTARELGH